MTLPHHPRPEPYVTGPLTPQGLAAVFDPCADFTSKELALLGLERTIVLCWLEGLVRNERLNDYVLRPLTTLRPVAGERLTETVCRGGVWCQNAKEQRTLADAVGEMLSGACVIFLPDGVVTCVVESEEKRAVSQPDNESETKAAKDSFVESLRTNTALIRRRLRSPHLCIRREIVGRQTRTPVEVLWLGNICDGALPERAAALLGEIDQEGLLTTAELEERLADPVRSAFPRLLSTERPDRVCLALLEGRVAVLAEGIPLALIAPAEAGQFLRAPQDRSYHFAAAGALALLRRLCVAVTLLLPGFYAAVVSFHAELIPTQLAVSIITSEQDVPFPVGFEVLGMLLAFEILQEAGLRLPKTIGQTVSIIGGLVVGQAAVEARIVSPAVVIVVAVAGITGFTVPDQDFANALRLWRLGLCALASAVGIFALTLGAAGLVLHLASLESLGVAYLTPQRGMLRPLKNWVRRPDVLGPINRRARG